MKKYEKFVLPVAQNLATRATDCFAPVAKESQECGCDIIVPALFAKQQYKMAFTEY